MFFSLIVARLITPMMAAYLMKPIPHKEAKDGLLMRGYTLLLHATNWGPRLTRKGKMTPEGRLPGRTSRPRIMSYITMFVGGGAVLWGSMQLIPLLPTGFIPPGDESRFVLSVELPPGSTLDDTLATAETMSKRIRENDQVTSVFILGGSSPTGSLEPRRAAIYVSLIPKSTDLWAGLANPTIRRINAAFDTNIPLLTQTGRIIPQSVVENDILPKLGDVPDIRWWKINDRGEREVTFNLLSDDPDALDQAVARLEGALRKEPTLRSVAATGALDRPEIRIMPKFDEAARLGITPEMISETVRVATIGDFGAALAKFNAGDRQIPIRVQIREDARSDIREISALKVTSSTGAAVPLTAVADVVFSQGPSSIERFNRERRAALGADLPPGVELGTAAATFERVAKEIGLPQGVRIQVGGDAEIQGEIFSGFAFAAGLGVVMMLGILVLLLNPGGRAGVLMISVPVAVGFGVLAQQLFGAMAPPAEGAPPARLDWWISGLGVLMYGSLAMMVWAIKPRAAWLNGLKIIASAALAAAAAAMALLIWNGGAVTPAYGMLAIGAAVVAGVFFLGSFALPWRSSSRCRFRSAAWCWRC